MSCRPSRHPTGSNYFFFPAFFVAFFLAKTVTSPHSAKWTVYTRNIRRMDGIELLSTMMKRRGAALSRMDMRDVSRTFYSLAVPASQ